MRKNDRLAPGQELELTARYLLDHETMDAEVFAKVFTDPGAEEFAHLSEA